MSDQSPAPEPAAPGSTLVPPLAAAPPALAPAVPVWTLGRLTKIEIENYRGVRGVLTLELPDGKNLLIYGENGTGKSSVFHAVRDFLESPTREYFDEKKMSWRKLQPGDYANRFSTKKQKPRVALHFASTEFAWSATETGPSAREMRDLDKAKGFLDYKALQMLHHLERGALEIDLFPLIIEHLLTHYPNTVIAGAKTLKEQWDDILSRKQVPRGRGGSGFMPLTQAELDTFNDGFETAVLALAGRATALLARFHDETTFEFAPFQRAHLHFPKKGRAAYVLNPPRLRAIPALSKSAFADYHSLFNEARLNALAICLFFAALKDSPAPGLRILALDDLLIGLDMSNRMKVLGLVEDLFDGWQIIITTYHKSWFEILKAHTERENWRGKWRAVTIRTQRALGMSQPLLVAASGTLLAQAQEHLDGGDTKAAAVYARSAWEAILSWYCAEWHLPVTYAESRRELDTDAFLRSIVAQFCKLRNGRDREWAHGVVQEIKYARQFVLNPHAHYDPEREDEISAEIADGIRAVSDFELLLRCLQKGDFAEPHEELDQTSVGELIRTAVEHLESNRRAAALDTLGRAFEQHLDELFRLRGEMVPYGMKVSRTFLFDLAGRRHIFAGLTWTLLRHSDPYFLGKVSPQHLNSAAFESAARLFLRLRIDFLIKGREHDLGAQEQQGSGE